MTDNKLPLYRVWHAPTLTMHNDVMGFAWQPKGQITRVVIVTCNEDLIEGIVSDFTLMRKSALIDWNNQSIYGGDIMRLSPDSKYPNEMFTVTEYDDGLWINREGIYLPISQAVHTYKAKVIGNIFQDSNLFEEIIGTA